MECRSRKDVSVVITISAYVNVLVISACGSIPMYSVASPCSKSVPAFQ